MGSGWHHYLSFPDGLDHIELKLPESRQILVDDRQLPTGEKQVLDTYEKFTLFNGSRFDTGFELSRPGEANTVELRDPARGIALQVIMKGGEWGYKYYQLFNHPDGAGFAVEPMTCNIDALNNEEGLITLAPGEQVQHEFQIRLAAH